MTIPRRAFLLAPLALAACDRLPLPGRRRARAEPSAPVPVRGTDPAALDATTAAERQAALGGAGGTLLGTDVLSLGDPAAQGLWVETPLVTTARPGRVVLVNGSASVQVELRPGAGGSRASLAVMRTLGVSLTDLPEVEIRAL